MRAEVWLRARQVTAANEVLIITGRGNQSVGGVGVIRQEILRLMPSLRRRGIVESWREHSPGSMVVKLAPTSALLLAGKRRRDTVEAPRQSTGGLAGLEAGTIAALRQLALQLLDSLGIEPDESFVGQEMARIFSTLTNALPEGPAREEALQASIRHALQEVSEGE